jgi:surface polysaccharide O-acyltransferase-like enzyme
MAQQRQRSTYIDILNILACFSVVWLHCTGRVFSYEPSRGWYMSLAFQTIAHFAVPVFFMLTGATLLEYRKRYSTKVFFQRRLIRIVVPFFIWSGIYILFGLRWNTVEVTGLWDIIDILLNNKAQYIFWFFYSLIGIYLCLPIVSLVIEHASRKIVVYFCLLCFMGQTVFPLIRHFGGWMITPYLEFPAAAGGFLGYVLLGWLVKTENWSRKMRVVVYIGGFLGAVLTFWATCILSAQKGALDSFWLGYRFPGCFLMALAIFLLVKHLPWEKWVPKDTKREKMIGVCSRASFGIYLIQIIFLRYVPSVFHLNINSVWYMIFGTILIYMLCLITVAVCQKIPVLRKLFP